MNNLPVASRSKKNAIVSLYQLTHEVAKEPLFLKTMKECRDNQGDTYLVDRNIQNEEDFIKYLKENNIVKPLYLCSAREISKNPNDNELWISLNNWMEQKAEEGTWEL